MDFVIEESSWAWDGSEPAAYLERVESLLDRLDVARERGEVFMASGELLAQRLVGERSLADLLWGEDEAIGLSHDLRERLTVLLGPLLFWDEDGVYPGLDVEIEGVEVFSPSAAYAHARVGAGDATACLPLPGIWRGPQAVFVDGRGESVHFVTDEATHRGFFRGQIAARKVEGAVEPLAPHAFPDTYFVDGVWRGLRDFEGGYTRVRDDLLSFLECFDDNAGWIYSDITGRLTRDEMAPPQGAPQAISNKILEDRFAALGLLVSPEAGDVHKNERSRMARERTIGGRVLYCEWHLKIERHINRVHFHAPVAESDWRPIVAIFHRHLYLPGD